MRILCIAENHTHTHTTHTSPPSSHLQISYYTVLRTQSPLYAYPLTGFQIFQIRATDVDVLTAAGLQQESGTTTPVPCHVMCTHLLL